MWACVEALVACDCMANQRHVKEEADLQEIAPEKARKACSQLPLKSEYFHFRGILF